MSYPLVSVIIPTYNRIQYVQLAIDSALAQSYPNCEVVVVDDGSTDGTGKTLRDRYGDRIRYFYQDNQGESAARNEAIRQSSGEFIALLDSDDVWLPAKLEQQLALFEANPELGLVSCHVTRINEQGDVVSRGTLHPEQTSGIVPVEVILTDSPVHASTITVRRNHILTEGGFDETITYGEDWDFCLRIAAKYPVGFVQEPLVRPAQPCHTHRVDHAISHRSS
jgi:glycosyltransferase involved in cell wall biosynthesis